MIVIYILLKKNITLNEQKIFEMQIELNNINFNLNLRENNKTMNSENKKKHNSKIK